MKYNIAIIIVIVGILLTSCKSHQHIVDSSTMSEIDVSDISRIYTDSIKVTDSTRVVITDSVTYIYRIINNNRIVSSHDTITVVDSIFINQSRIEKVNQKDDHGKFLWLFACVAVGLVFFFVLISIIQKKIK